MDSHMPSQDNTTHYCLRDDAGCIRAIVDDDTAQQLMAGGAGEIGERKLQSGEMVLIYRITAEGVTVDTGGGITLFIHPGDYLRRV